MAKMPSLGLMAATTTTSTCPTVGQEFGYCRQTMHSWQRAWPRPGVAKMPSLGRMAATTSTAMSISSAMRARKVQDSASRAVEVVQDQQQGAVRRGPLPEDGHQQLLPQTHSYMKGSPALYMKAAESGHAILYSACFRPSAQTKCVSEQIQVPRSLQASHKAWILA